MWPPKVLPLALVLLLSMVRTASMDHAPSPVQALRQWLRDSVARRGLLEIWGHDTRALSVAYDAAAAAAAAPPSDAASLRCLRDIEYLKATQAVWAFQMLDASVKVPEGLLVGSWIHLGNWDECVSVRDQARSAAGSERFHGQMCMVALGAAVDEGGAGAGRRRREEGERQLLRAAALDAGAGVGADLNTLLDSVELQLAVCVPSSCNSSHVQQLFASALQGTVEVGNYNLSLEVSVEENGCTTRDRPSLDAADWTAVGVLSALAAVVVLSTAYDLLAPATRTKPLFVAFSVVSNGRKLLAAPRAGGDQTLSCLHGIRFLSMCWVVLGHRYYASINYPNVNPTFLQTFMQDWLRVGITNATVSVDTFFMLSGLLVAYLFFKQVPSNRRFNIPMYYIHRYIRLTPAFAMMILLSASLLFRLGWGPRWSVITDPQRASCQKSWWNNLLYVSNYVDAESNCVGQSWYLMVDMQLHWLSPLLLLPMARWPRAGWAAIGVLSAAGIGTSFAVSYAYSMPGNVFAESEADASMKYFRYYYIPAYTRYVPYLEGVAIGYILGNRQALGRKPRPLSFVGSALAWLSVAALMLVPLFTGTLFLQQPAPTKVAAAIYNALHRPAWALGVAGAVFLCANGNGGAANRLLSWTGFQILGRLSYCVYLVHMSIQTVETASARTYTYLADGVLLPAFASDLFLAVLLAALLSILCEAPFIALEKHLLGGAPRAKSPPTAVKAPASKEASNVV